MSSKNLAQEINSIRNRINLLNNESSQPDDERQMLLLETIEELRTSLEELQVAEEELRVQNESLIQAQREIDLERQRYQDLFDFAPEGYIVTSKDGTIKEANRAAVSMLGVARKFLIGKPLLTYIEEEDRKALRFQMNSFSNSSEQSKVEIEVRVRPRDGQTVVAGETVDGHCDDHGKPTTFRWSLRDITQRKQAEEEIKKLNSELEQRVNGRTAELLAANRAKDELLRREQQTRAEAEAANHSKDAFLATLSHELRTPLNAIIGWVHILRTQKFNPEKLAHAIDVIERNAQSQSQIVDDILEVSRIITGHLQLEKEPISLKPVIEAAIDSVQHMAEAKRIKIISSLDPGAGFVAGDPNRLQQVALNLLTNALKFTNDGGNVEVRLERADYSARLTVSDTGAGISPDFLPHIFDRFSQADSASTRKYGGLGLGLSIVHHIVKQHGGRVKAISEGEGKGACFIVDLPLINMSHKASDESFQPRNSEPPSSTSSNPDLSGIWVIVIDDEMDAREMLKTVLEQWGAKVTAVGTVAEVIEALADEQDGKRPDVLVADIAMPEEDGFDLIRKVRKLGPNQGGEIPAIALTAYAATEDRLRVLSEGYQMHVAKPVSLFELGSIVKKLAR